MTLSDFLKHHVPGYAPPKFGGRPALIRGHCHHKSVLGFQSERQLLKEMEIEFQEPEDGCSGIAGSFGFERRKVTSGRPGSGRVFQVLRREDHPGLQ